ncbi:RDD family protein [Candidatus Poriferisodalis sp.]|uniref:RDD family protein n=1 Tax=Candidatus Poriferisodalis sp. TaxID=3101277 RepID=UPI003B019145
MSDELEPSQPGPYLGVTSAGPFRRLTAHLIDGLFGLLVFMFWWFIFVYLACWLFLLAWGQTPGKFLTGLVAVRSDGTPFGWGRMFVREIFQRLFWSVSLGFGAILDAGVLMLSGDRRSVTDRVAGSTIVRVSAVRS